METLELHANVLVGLGNAGYLGVAYGVWRVGRGGPLGVVEAFLWPLRLCIWFGEKLGGEALAGFRVKGHVGS